MLCRGALRPEVCVHDRKELFCPHQETSKAADHKVAAVLQISNISDQLVQPVCAACNRTLMCQVLMVSSWQLVGGLLVHSCYLLHGWTNVAAAACRLHVDCDTGRRLYWLALLHKRVHALCLLEAAYGCIHHKSWLDSLVI